MGLNGHLSNSSMVSSFIQGAHYFQKMKVDCPIAFSDFDIQEHV